MSHILFTEDISNSAMENSEIHYYVCYMDRGVSWCEMQKIVVSSMVTSDNQISQHFESILKPPSRTST